MKKDLYQIIKEELKKRRENVKYFNRAFFNKYVQAIKDYETLKKSGIDDSYKDGIITKYHHYDNIYIDNFYVKNSGCYCEFLAVVSPYYKKIIAG